MIELLVKLIPYLLFIYFLVRSYREPAFLLSIPFLMFFGHCIFFWKVKLFYIPHGLSDYQFILVWLIIVWFIFSKSSLFQSSHERIDYYQYKGINWLDWFVIGLIIISFIDFMVVLKEYTFVKDVYDEFISLLALFLGFFVIKDMVRYINPITLQDFFYNVVIINSIASLLYFIHQGLHIQLYTGGEEYSEELFQGVIITRTFWFMPILWFFSVAYLIIFREGKLLISGILLTINFLAIFISYTRSFVVIAFVVILAYFILTAYKNRNFFTVFKNLAIVAFSGLVLFFAVSKFLPASTNYFRERVKELQQDPSDEESNSLIYRMNMTGKIFNRMDVDKRMTGYGPVTESQLAWVEDMKGTTADMVWTEVVFRWGYVGLALFILLYVVSIIKSFNLYMKSEGMLSQLALLFFLMLVSQILESFVSWTFMAPNRSTMSLWYFGVLAALIGFDKQAYFFKNEPNVES